MNITKTTKSAAETQKFGEEFAQKIKDGGVVCLFGDLGAGKTTLVQGIARGLGIRQRITSPTFIVVRRYELKNQNSKIKNTSQKSKVKYLWHIDLYRLNNIKEIKVLGIEELWQDTNNILLIEWPEKIKSALPQNRWVVKLKQAGENRREITVSRHAN